MSKKTNTAKTSQSMGRFVLCPFSNVDHGVVAVEIKRLNSDWAVCSVCGARLYRNKGKKRLDRMLTARQAIGLGAIVPEALIGMPEQSLPPPVIPPRRRTAEKKESSS